MLGRNAKSCRDADRARRAPIEHAIARGEVQVLFQPVVRLVDGATIGYEALARLGERGDAPAPWFRAARELDLGTELELMCVAAIVHQGLLPGEGLLFVNVSPATLVHPRMHELCGPLAKRLVVELTEHIEILDYAALQLSIDRWCARGARLAVDDTGAGYASLRHVLELAPHFLKLDRSVVGGVDQHGARRALVAALVTFADEVDTTVIAEGVERWSEAETLRDLGVHLAQGFAFGRPAARRQPGEWPAEDRPWLGVGARRAVPEALVGVRGDHARRT